MRYFREITRCFSRNNKIFSRNKYFSRNNEIRFREITRYNMFRDITRYALRNNKIFFANWWDIWYFREITRCNATFHEIYIIILSLWGLYASILQTPEAGLRKMFCLEFEICSSLSLINNLFFLHSNQWGIQKPQLPRKRLIIEPNGWKFGPREYM